jgi:thiol-disulfide isomerase/thioredoxin
MKLRSAECYEQHAGTLRRVGRVEAGVTGLVVLVVVLVVATAFGVWRRRTDGRLRRIDPMLGRARETGSARDGSTLLTSADLGHDLGSRATLVQVSSAFCAPCRAARQVLAHTAGQVDGVRHVEVDAETHLDLVRRLGVTKTPTMFVLDADGRIVRRAVGVPRLPELRATVNAIVRS